MRWLVVLVAACTPPASAPSPPAPGGPEFPRIASYYIESHVSPEARDVMARSDLVIVDAEAGALDRAPLDAIRRARPDGMLLAYLTSEEIARAPSAEQPLAAARLPRIPPAAWLLEPGSRLVRPVGADDTRWYVADPRAFAVKRPASAFYGADEPTYVLVDGEHARLIAIDGDALVVERGRGAPHAAGARVAAHVVFFAGTWMLDVASPAWRALLADEAARLVAAGPWTGIFLDVCFEDIAWLNGGLLDVDADGIADDRTAASRTWLAGMRALVHELRERVGPSVPIVSNPGAQDCPIDELDGILLEGWPIGMPPDYVAFATGEERYARWSRHGRGLAIANGFSPQIKFGTIAPGDDAVARADVQAMRFGLAVALQQDGFYTFDNGVFGHYVAWWYPAYDGGGRGRHWLGRALGPSHTDGALRWRAFEHGTAAANVGEVPVTFRGRTIAPHDGAIEPR